MAIEIDYDTTRLPMGSLEWTSLLAAIEAAAPEDESDWIEWKSTLDLTDKNHLAHIAKAIIAFANRDPAVASQRVEGRGLLIVGVTPGRVQGVVPETQPNSMRRSAGFSARTDRVSGSTGSPTRRRKPSS
jgi:schlafen family protein